MSRDLFHLTAPSLKNTGSLCGVLRPLSRLLGLIKERLTSASGKRSKNRESDDSSEKISNAGPNNQGDDKLNSADKSDVSDISNSDPHPTGSDPSISNLEETDQGLSKNVDNLDAIPEASPAGLAQSRVENPEEFFVMREHPDYDQLAGFGSDTSPHVSKGSEPTQGPQFFKFFKRQFESHRARILRVVSTFFEQAASIARAGFIFSVVGHLPWLVLSVYFNLSRNYLFAPDYLLDMPTGVIHWIGVALGGVASLLWFSMRSGELREDRNDSVRVVTYSAKDVQKKAESSVHQYKNATIINRSAEQKLDGTDKIELRAVRIPGRVAGSIFKNLRSAVLDIGLLGTLYWSSMLSATVGYSTIPSNPGLVFWFGLGCVAADWMLRGVKELFGGLRYKFPRR